MALVYPFVMQGDAFVMQGDAYVLQGAPVDVSQLPGTGLPNMSGIVATKDNRARLGAGVEHMAGTVLVDFEISSPGRDPYGAIGFDALRRTNAYVAGVLQAIGDVLAEDPPPVMASDLEEITVGDVRISEAPIIIAGATFEAGQALLFTLEAAAGVTPDADRAYKSAAVRVDATSAAGLRIRGQKTLRVYPFLPVR